MTRSSRQTWWPWELCPDALGPCRLLRGALFTGGVAPADGGRWPQDGLAGSHTRSACTWARGQSVGAGLPHRSLAWVTSDQNDAAGSFQAGHPEGRCGEGPSRQCGAPEVLGPHPAPDAVPQAGGEPRPRVGPDLGPAQGPKRRASSPSPRPPGPPVGVVTSAFGGAQTPGPWRRGHSGEARREGLWVPVRQVRVPAPPLTRPSAQPGTEARVTVSTRKAPRAERCWGRGPQA